MSKELYNQLSVKLDFAIEALGIAERFANEHGLIMNFTLDGDQNYEYFPDVPMDKIIPEDGDDLYRFNSLMEYYREDVNDTDDATGEYERVFRGQWVSSSAYCP